MPKFFESLPDTPAHTTSMPTCGSCGLYKGCRSPKMQVTGEGRRRVLIVAEAPGQDEDRQGIQLIGMAGQALRKHLRKIGVDLDRDCWKTNAVICHPGSMKNPTDKQVLSCRPNLLKVIRELEPDVILLLGGASVKSLIGYAWREDVGQIERWTGWQIPSQLLNVWLCPTWHPSYLMRQGDPVLDLWFVRHLKVAFELEGKPWPDEKTDWTKQITVEYAPRQAAVGIRKLIEAGKPMAIDYETDRLKPDADDSRIVCCAVSDGKTTISFPWQGDAVTAVGELLQSEVGKLAHNIKFEERWSQHEFGRGVRNWEWCSMTAAHVLDNRRGITGLKFQSFVNFGVGDYDREISPYLKGEGGNGKNRVTDAPLDRLLLYCGMDALLGFKLAEKQREVI